MELSNEPELRGNWHHVVVEMQCRAAGLASWLVSVAMGRLQAHTSPSLVTELSHGPDCTPCFRDFHTSLRAPLELQTPDGVRWDSHHCYPPPAHRA